jgi:hypothetical protein
MRTLGPSSATPRRAGHTLSSGLRLLDVLGDLVQTTDGKWMTRPPSRCPNGHPLRANQALAGHVACRGLGGGGHTSWHCRTCDAVVSGPPLNTHCPALEGPAAVRISTQRSSAT